MVAIIFSASSCNKSASNASAPEENRFEKTILNQGELFEPTEMTILPNLDIVVLQRRGQIMYYSNTTKKLSQAGQLNVYCKADNPMVNSEEGLLGITVDPDFASNHYVYIYYSPIDVSVDRLSRFELNDGVLDLKSEKKILEVNTQREICCHTGGSLAFGSDNQLFLSTGDNSTPFDEGGQKYPTHAFGPMDDRPGHKQYDSRRSAANTNDLRGKILRVKINSDGSYDIPSDNLFPKGTAKARPEIYVMGDRNPYRISVDKKTGYLYWGEVGPDATVDSFATRGPRGYDELNQARKAGNFGWPLFVANNQAYHRHNYQTNTNGPAYDPEHPVNESRNNTGLLYLPPAQPAFIWYPYGVSKEFPLLGSGGRTAMAGPIYNYSDYPSDTRYPEYYDKKLFIYDFIRGWIKAVTMKPNGDYEKMEDFIPHTKFNGMIDMEMGPDGRIYVLEYGNGWFTKNPEACITRIDYLPGNRPPAVSDLKVNRTTGNLPYVLNATVKALDPENDPLTYTWHIGSATKQTNTPSLNYTINQPGDYDVTVEVADDKKASTKSDVIAIYAGNEQPKVDITLAGAPNFYFPGKPVNYQVAVSDNGDKVNLNNLYISTKYINANNLAGAALGDHFVPASVLGKNLMLSLDCMSCHKIDQASIGPQFKNVAKKYAKNRDALNFLPTKIIKGGSGNWGEVAMSAHPTLKEGDARSIVEWILTLADTVPKARSLPQTGTIVPMPDPKQPQNTVFALTANYTDNGGPGIRALAASKTVYLRSNTVDAAEFQNVNGFMEKDSMFAKYWICPVDTGDFKISSINPAGIGSIQLTGFTRGAAASYRFAIVADKITGPQIGQGDMKFGTTKQKVTTNIPVKFTADGKAHSYYLIFKKASGGNANLPLLKSVSFMPGR